MWPHIWMTGRISHIHKGITHMDANLPTHPLPPQYTNTRTDGHMQIPRLFQSGCITSSSDLKIVHTD